MISVTQGYGTQPTTTFTLNVLQKMSVPRDPFSWDTWVDLDKPNTTSFPEQAKDLHLLHRGQAMYT